MSNQYSSILHPADTTGCSFYRMTSPYLAVQSAVSDVNITIARRFVTDQQFFSGINMVMAQRQVSESQMNYFTKFLSPLSKTRGIWTIYNVDDALYKDDIPLYNKSRDMYQDDKLMDNIKSIMNVSDYVVVTTDVLKQYYNDRFDVPLGNILVIPNYLPHWWMSGRFDINKSMTRLNKYKKKPRVGIISSTSHFDINNINNGKDDITHIVEFISKSVNKYQWVLFGTVPPTLKSLVDSGKIEFSGGCDILTYPHALDKLELNVIVAPLEDNVFNRCKSNIKLIEGWAMGIPVIAQNLPTYSDYTDMVFDNGIDLEKKLDKLFNDPQKYRKIIKDNFNIVEHGNKDAPIGWWLEKNINKWAPLFKLRSKTIEIDLERYIDSKKIDDTSIGVIK